jgi:hypothetical protein
MNHGGYEYSILKRRYAEITADIQGWIARRRALRDAAIKAVMRAEIQRAEERISKFIERTIRLVELTDERQNFRLTVIEKKLDIPTTSNPLVAAPQHQSVSEQNEIEALLSTPQLPLPGPGLLAPASLKDRAKEDTSANRV